MREKKERKTKSIMMIERIFREQYVMVLSFPTIPTPISTLYFSLVVKTVFLFIFFSLFFSSASVDVASPVAGHHISLRIPDGGILKCTRPVYCRNLLPKTPTDFTRGLSVCVCVLFIDRCV